jgi:D-beta-D-heptose 7-phosphate kinase/D-beta-D-heptose 1-phosphate adenosyltransferase
MKKIFTNGCFDILHTGHIELLKYCATLGRVTVGLNSDSSVAKLKGPDRPINFACDRKQILLSLRSVDEVIIFEEETPIELIKLLKPDIIVKGGDYLAAEIIGSEFAEIRIFEFMKGYSTTSIVDKIRKNPRKASHD